MLQCRKKGDKSKGVDAKILDAFYAKSEPNLPLKQDLPPVNRPIACVLHGVPIEAEEMEKLYPFISRGYDGQYEDLEEFFGDTSIGIYLEEDDYFVWQPNNLSDSKNYIVLSYRCLGPEDETENKKLDKVSPYQVENFMSFLKRVDIPRDRYGEYLVFCYNS